MTIYILGKHRSWFYHAGVALCQLTVAIVLYRVFCMKSRRPTYILNSQEKFIVNHQIFHSYLLESVK